MFSFQKVVSFAISYWDFRCRVGRVLHSGSRMNEIFSVYVYCLPCAAVSELSWFNHNDICFLISVVLFGVVSLGLRTTSLVTVLTFETFPVVHCSKFAVRPTILLESWWYHWIFFPLTPHWVLGNAISNFVCSEKSTQRQSRERPYLATCRT